jgi:UDP-N-acetylglucosamine 2-epimerase
LLKVFIASFNRASNGAISKLKQKMIDKRFYTEDYNEADYILAVGDRVETFDFVLQRYRENKKIIHLCAGETSKFELHDDMYRHSITLMSCIQLCTNNEAKDVVKNLCEAVGKKYSIITIGNIMLDNLEIDESYPIEKPYDLILYNPLTSLPREKVEEELSYICGIKKTNYIWIAPNGDPNSDLVNNYINTPNLPRRVFLGLLKNCNRFITNSSCQYYEAQFLINPKKIISIGERNKERNSKYANMGILNASDNIIKLLELIENG